MVSALDLYRQRFPRRDEETPKQYQERLLDEMQADRQERLDVRTSQQRNDQKVVR